MHANDQVRKAFSIALCLFIGGSSFAGQPVKAGWVPKNPFHKAKPVEDKPPPGMTDTDDASTSPTDKTLGRDQEEESKDEEKTHNTAESPADEKLDIVDSDPDMHVRIAKSMLRHKKYKEALEQVNEALKLNKNLWEARYLGAYIYQMEGRNAEAISRYRQYLSFKPEDAQAHINLGVVLKQEAKTEEAEEEFRRAIEINGRSLEAHYNLANLLIYTNELEPALKELRACEKIAPTNAWVHNNLGVIYLKREYYEEAEQEFNRAANLEPANTVFSQNLTMVREHLAKKKQAKASSTM